MARKGRGGSTPLSRTGKRLQARRLLPRPIAPLLASPRPLAPIWHQSAPAGPRWYSRRRRRSPTARRVRRAVLSRRPTGSPVRSPLRAGPHHRRNVTARDRPDAGCCRLRTRAGARRAPAPDRWASGSGSRRCDGPAVTDHRSCGDDHQGRQAERGQGPEQGVGPVEAIVGRRGNRGGRRRRRLIADDRADRGVVGARGRGLARARLRVRADQGVQRARGRGLARARLRVRADERVERARVRGLARARLRVRADQRVDQLCAQSSCPVLCWEPTSALLPGPSVPAMAVPAGTMAPTTTIATIVRVLIEVYISSSFEPGLRWGDRAGVEIL